MASNVLLNIDQVDWLEPFSQSSDKYGIWPWDLFIYEPERYSKLQSTYIPRVRQCLSPVRIGTSQPPLPQASVYPPEPGGGGVGGTLVHSNSDNEKAEFQAV
jgi:hypothetical protein